MQLLYVNKILEMYKNSYSAIGLIDFGGWDGMKNYLNCSCYLLIDETDDLYGIILYWLGEYGNKISLVISLTPEIGKTYIIPKLIELLRTPGFYIELSGALEYLVRKNGLDNIKDKTIIKSLIPQLIDEDIFDERDERRVRYLLNIDKHIPSPPGSFLREIKDIGIHRKALYGLPCLNKQFNKSGCDRICISHGGKNKKRKKTTRKKRVIYNNSRRVNVKRYKK